MYAVIEANGKQFKVREGDVIRLDRIGGAVDSTVVFDRVLLAHDGEKLIVSGSAIGNAKVSAKVVRQAAGPKIVAFRYKPKKRVRRRHGHRQPITELRIEKISL